MKRQWRRKFIRALSKLGSVTHACKAIGVSRISAYLVRERDPKFKAQWDAALERAVDYAQDCFFIRATKGIKEPIGIDKDGNPVIKRIHSDKLLIKLLESWKPERYAPKVDKPQENKEPVTEVNITVKQVDKPAESKSSNAS